MSEHENQLDSPCIMVSAAEDFARVREAHSFLKKQVSQLVFMRYTKIERHANFLSGTLAIPRKNAKNISYALLTFFIDSQHFFIFGKGAEDVQFAQKILSNALVNMNQLDEIVYAFFDGLIDDDYKHLDEIESKIALLEQQLLDGQMNEFDSRIMKLRKNLLYLHRFYNGLTKICQEFEEDKKGYFCKENLHMFTMLVEDIDRLSNHIYMLLDYSIQVIDLNHTRLEAKQNKIMQTLTVVTAIFMPLTLIVGWYGMNFINMPELQWDFGYVAVAVLSAIVVLITVIIFKKKHFL